MELSFVACPAGSSFYPPPLRAACFLFFVFHRTIEHVLLLGKAVGPPGPRTSNGQIHTLERKGRKGPCRSTWEAGVADLCCPPRRGSKPAPVLLLQKQRSSTHWTGHRAGHGQAAACPGAPEDKAVPEWNWLWSSRPGGGQSLPRWAQLASFPFGGNCLRAWLDRPSESAVGGIRHHKSQHRRPANHVVYCVT